MPRRPAPGPRLTARCRGYVSASAWDTELAESARNLSDRPLIIERAMALACETTASPMFGASSDLNVAAARQRGNAYGIKRTDPAEQNRPQPVGCHPASPGLAHAGVALAASRYDRCRFRRDADLVRRTRRAAPPAVDDHRRHRVSPRIRSRRDGVARPEHHPPLQRRRGE